MTKTNGAQHDPAAGAIASETDWDRLSQQLAVLPDRAGIVTILDRELRMAEEDGLPVGLVFIDLDAFRRINDTLGHGQGDNLLAVTADRISAHTVSYTHLTLPTIYAV